MQKHWRFSSLIAGAVALIGLLPVTTWGADLKLKAPPPVAVPPPVWTGFYFGGHIGGAWTDWESDTSFLAVPVPPAVGAPILRSFPGPDGTNASFLGGVQAGYNWQSGNWVFGAEADVSFLTDGLQQVYGIPSATLIAAGLGAILGGPDGFESNWDRRMNWLATARLRAGYTVRPDLLLYVTGGLAVAGLESSTTFSGLIDDGVVRVVQVASARQWTGLGYAVGGGGEWAFDRNWSVKLEYLFVDLGEESRPLGTYLNVPCCRQTAAVTESVTAHVARIGVNYRFAPQ